MLCCFGSFTFSVAFVFNLFVLAFRLKVTASGYMSAFLLCSMQSKVSGLNVVNATHSDHFDFFFLSF